MTPPGQRTRWISYIESSTNAKIEGNPQLVPHTMTSTIISARTHIPMRTQKADRDLVPSLTLFSGTPLSKIIGSNSGKPRNSGKNGHSLCDKFHPDVVKLVLIEWKSLCQAAVTGTRHDTGRPGKQNLNMDPCGSVLDRIDVQVPMNPCYPLRNQRVQITSRRLNVHQVKPDLQSGGKKKTTHQNEQE